MAQSATEIPWMLLVGRLEYVSYYSSPDGTANIRLRPSQPSEDYELLRFKHAFAEKISNDSIRERQKFPYLYKSPKPDEVVLSDTVIGRVGDTIRRSRTDIITQHASTGTEYTSGVGFFRRRLEPYYRLESSDYSCEVTHRDRKAEGLTPKSKSSSCVPFGETVIWPTELIKTLIICGEMDPILRTARGTLAGLESLPWTQTYSLALKSYICLNVLRYYSRIGNSAGRTDETPRVDYRSLKCYQKTLVSCTQRGFYTNVEKYPHRDFFGISKDQFSHQYLDPNGNRRGRTRGDERPYGLVSIENLLSLEKPQEYMPTKFDVNAVFLTLRRLGLPAELVCKTMEYADYAVRSRLRVPNDPLHPDNRDELESYLTQCWQILVRCDMMARAGGISIDWAHAVIGVCTWRVFW